MVGGVLGAGLAVTWSLFETAILGSRMFGHLVPAVVAGALGYVAGILVGACVGLVVARWRRPRAPDAGLPAE